MSGRARNAFLLAGLILAGCSGAPANQSKATAADATPPDISGFWVRTDEAGSGSFGAMFAGITPAELVPAAKAEIEASKAAQAAEAAKAKAAAVDGVYRVPAHCNGPNIVFMMQHSGAIDILQSKDEVLVIPEHPGTQHIYMDGRPHPALADWEPSGAGHSVGHYEGGEFVVSTVGMAGKGVNVPGGGLVGPETELVERFRLRDPQHMIVRFTWTDPKIYVKPHSYELTYEKQPEDSYAFESWCDVTDPLQGQSIVVPKQ